MTAAKRFLPSALLLILFLGLGQQVRAATITAASCNESDVQTAVSAALAGDTVVIPAGTCTWTATLSIKKPITLMGSGTPNAGPNTFGAGMPTTILIQNIINSNPLIALTGITTGQTARISLLDIEPESKTTSLGSPLQVSGMCTAGGCPYFRIDNIIFGKTTPWTESGNGSPADSMIRTDNAFGVIDHNTVPIGAQSTFANIQLSAYLGVGGYGDNSWAQPDSFGEANNVFMENNSLQNALTVTDTEFAPAGGAVGGARQVGRFNEINSVGGSYGAFEEHGLDTAGRPQGGRQIEAYDNTITCTGGACNTAAASYRGGTGLVFGNTITADYQKTGGYYNAIANITVYRAVYAASSGWGACGGSSPYDTDDGTVYYGGTMTATNGSLTMTDTSKNWSTNQLVPKGAPYSVYDRTQGFWAEIVSNTADTITVASPISESGWTGFKNGDSYQILRATVCVDQGGRGQGNYVSGATPLPALPLNQALDPVYEFADSFTGSLNQGHFTSNYGTTIANRDWYTDNGAGQQTSPASPFNGMSGVGWGTLANRPTTCTPGVGYWATDQGSWNQSGNSFGQGQLYVCTAGNNWTMYYEPFTYPYPLTANGLPDPSAGSGGGSVDGGFSAGASVPAPVLAVALPSTGAGTSVASSFTRDLGFGDTGGDVGQLQLFLISKNSGPAAADLAKAGATSYFGALTRAALAEFQASVGITPAAGYFGPITQAYVSAHP